LIAQKVGMETKFKKYPNIFSYVRCMLTVHRISLAELTIEYQEIGVKKNCLLVCALKWRRNKFGGCAGLVARSRLVPSNAEEK
jgi:hypothetical protein